MTIGVLHAWYQGFVCMYMSCMHAFDVCVVMHMQFACMHRALHACTELCMHECMYVHDNICMQHTHRMHAACMIVLEGFTHFTLQALHIPQHYLHTTVFTYFTLYI